MSITASRRRREQAQWEIETQVGVTPDSQQDARATDKAEFGIGDLASEFAITTRTIRFYEAKGLLVPKRLGTHRLYSKRDRARLILILRGKRLGFSLDEIAEYLDLYDKTPDHAVQTRHLLNKVELSITDLERKRQDIERTLAELGQIREQCVAALDD